MGLIDISSVDEDWPMPGDTPYCLSDGGARMLTRTAGQDDGLMHSRSGL